MVKYKTEAKELDLVFASLADPTRRDILRRIAQSPLTVSEVAAPFHMSLPAISKHLSVLERAELITREKRGRQQWVVLNPAPLKTAAEHVAYYQAFWNSRLDTLEQYLQKEVSRNG